MSEFDSVRDDLCNNNLTNWQKVGKRDKVGSLKRYCHKDGKLQDIGVRKIKHSRSDYWLENKVDLWKKIDHPNVVRCLWAGKDGEREDDDRIICCEYVEGRTLAEVMAGQGSGGLVESEALKYFQQLVEALEHLHSGETPIVSGDLNQDNVLIDRERETLKLIDIGGPKIKDKEVGSLASVRSLKNMAPELNRSFATNLAGVTQESDIWSAGCILYYMLAGSLPFTKHSQYHIGILSQEDIEGALAKYLPQTTSEMCKVIIVECMKQEAALRPSAVELKCFMDLCGKLRDVTTSAVPKNAPRSWFTGVEAFDRLLTQLTTRVDLTSPDSARILDDIDELKIPQPAECVKEQYDLKSLRVKKSVAPRVGDDIYKRFGDKPGVALIINNDKFSPGIPARPGSEKDGEDLKNVFSQMKYNVKLCKNLTAEEIHAEVEELNSDPSLKQCDSVVTIVLSHGDADDVILGCDGLSVRSNDIIQPFIANTNLTEKPKIFIFQACRGVARDQGAGSGTVDTSKPLVQPKSFNVKVPTHADVFVAYSTVPGYVAWKNTVYGSWFVNAICNVFAEHAHYLELNSLFTKVHKQVARRWAGDGSVQIPQVFYQLTNNFYFNPGC